MFSNNKTIPKKENALKMISRENVFTTVCSMFINFIESDLRLLRAIMVRCWYYLSNNASSVVLSHGTIYLVCSSNF